jgi:spore coat protein U-like protein
VIVRLALAVGLGLVAVARPAVMDAAQLSNCTISTSGVAFGSYSVFNSAATDSTGTINYQCTLGILIRVELSKGSSTTFDPRKMTNASNALNYNLFLDSTRTTIWGDGSGSTGRISHIVVALFPHSATVYGRVPALQNVAAGGYTDSVTASIVF